MKPHTLKGKATKGSTGHVPKHKVGICKKEKEKQGVI